ncbi:16S rRNA (cytidine(1402)-2'-O)-methyltransferase [Tepidibacter aestuarii]|uniref:16S rRNA (cytidine(1402)-2'-O)-methyltransferase n=1 Tax=Tepidibacter aestuarii TaxID=2925782 RepID=UPI0020C03F8A|nr:16S rRNA (cytidine(1402)-2'-O)-methyltransferase [Tepidibacter aestuarii]CAH2215177.1 16S rRNA 2'-O-ribose C1402 methyltransferase [Tepidibacter aestuarii]
MKGNLYVCATPIGNLEDITIRTLNTLKEVDLIAAEDTRHSIKLLNHFSISKPLTSYHEHNKDSKGSVIIEKMLNGENVAIITDAGMPGISDPGEDLIRQAIDAGIKVDVLPGATAFVTALVGSGLKTRKFAFEGFLNRDKKIRRQELEELKHERRTLIFYESPHRLKNTLSDILSILGDRQISICREITKKYEEIIRTSVEDALNIFKEREIKGEFVLILDGFSGEIQSLNNNDDLSIREYVTKLIEDGMSKKDATKHVAKERKLPKNEVYQEVLDL